MAGISLIASLVLAQGQGWPVPSSLILEGYEKLGSGPERPFRIQVSKGKSLIATRRGILDWPGGPTRLESNSSAGFFTWIEGGNRTLRLAVPSHSDLQTWTQPVRFSKASVSGGQLPGWKLGISESIADRPTWKVSSSAKAVQSLWIDQTYGWVLRQEDETSGGAISYRRLATSIQVDAPVADQLFEPPSNLPLLGVPHPIILTRPSLTRPLAAYQPDVEEVKKRSRLGAELWLKRIEPPTGFEYSGTHSEESRGKLVREVWPRNKLGGPEFEPGGLPPGWSARAEIDPEGQGMFVRFTQNGQPGPIVKVGMPGSQGASSFKITQAEFENGVMRETANIQYTAFLADDGALVFGLGQDLAQARLRRENSKLDLSKANVFVQSDFVETSTGHTFSFFQVRGREWHTCALLPRLNASAKFELEGANFESWTLPAPFPLRALAWTSDGTTYVVASSKLSERELAEVAKKVR